MIKSWKSKDFSRLITKTKIKNQTLALSRPPLGQKRRKQREQKGEGENRDKQEEIKKETRENQVQGYSKVFSCLLCSF